TPGRRGSSVSDFAEITRSTPEKSLVRPLTKSGGRNGHGRITTRHRGGGHKRAYRLIDFRRHDKDGVPAKSKGAPNLYGSFVNSAPGGFLANKLGLPKPEK